MSNFWNILVGGKCSGWGESEVLCGEKCTFRKDDHEGGVEETGGGWAWRVCV